PGTVTRADLYHQDHDRPRPTTELVGMASGSGWKLVLFAPFHPEHPPAGTDQPGSAGQPLRNRPGGAGHRRVERREPGARQIVLVAQRERREAGQSERTAHGGLEGVLLVDRLERDHLEVRSRDG